MVEYAKEPKGKTLLKSGIVCPKCFKPMSDSIMLPVQKDGYGRRLRQYMGWCLECQLGSEVVQFMAGEKWILHKYRYYAVIAQTGKNIPSGGWQIVNSLPEAPAVVMGTGGDYIKGYTPQTIDLMRTLLNALKATVKTVESLLNMAATKHE